MTLSGEELADARMRLDRDLCLIARNVDFRGSTEARWKASPLPLTQSTQGLSRPASNPAVSQLEQFLYGSFFCRPLRNAVASEPSMHEQDIDLVPVLSAANRGSDGWDPQWQIEEVLPSGQAVLRKGTRRRHAWPGEFACRLGLGTRPQPGMPVDLLIVRESLTRQPGAYFAFGPVHFDDNELSEILRIYWNLRPGGAALLVAEVTSAFHRMRLPFMFKCMARTGLLDRCDGAVLYTARRHFSLVLTLVADIYRAVRSHLGADVSPFVKPLAAGLSLAEDPTDGGSFGMNRCRLVADALWLAHVSGVRGETGLVDAVSRYLRWCGVDPMQPYLNFRSLDRYVVPDDLRSAFDRAA